MDAETKNHEPYPAHDQPLPPPAHFDLEHLALAKPVKPLSVWHRSLGALQRIFGPHVIAVAVLVAVSVIGFTAATSAVDFASPVESANTDDTVASTGRSVAEEAVATGETEPATPVATDKYLTTQVERPVSHPTRRVKRMLPRIELRRLPPNEFDEDSPAGRTRPRLVAIIH